MALERSKQVPGTMELLEHNRGGDFREKAQTWLEEAPQPLKARIAQMIGATNPDAIDLGNPETSKLVYYFSLLNEDGGRAEAILNTLWSDRFAGKQALDDLREERLPQTSSFVGRLQQVKMAPNPKQDVLGWLVADMLTVITFTEKSDIAIEGYDVETLRNAVLSGENIRTFCAGLNVRHFHTAYAKFERKIAEWRSKASAKLDMPQSPIAILYMCLDSELTANGNIGGTKARLAREHTVRFLTSTDSLTMGAEDTEHDIDAVMARLKRSIFGLWHVQDVIDDIPLIAKLAADGTPGKIASVINGLDTQTILQIIAVLEKEGEKLRPGKKPELQTFIRNIEDALIRKLVAEAAGESGDPEQAIADVMQNYHRYREETRKACADDDDYEEMKSALTAQKPEGADDEEDKPFWITRIVRNTLIPLLKAVGVEVAAQRIGRRRR